jgi:putative signal transducing protein
VDVSREELTERFGNLSDEEVLEHLRNKTLTPLAREVAGDILRSRGIDPLPALAAVESIIEPDAEDIDLVTVSIQWNPLQANLLRALLESHGIFAYVWGEHLASTNVILSTAGGGSQVQVRSDQVSQARELIAAFQRGELTIPDLPDEHVATGQAVLKSSAYSFSPSNPYAPSPSVIDALAIDRPAARPQADMAGETSRKPSTHPRTDTAGRTP